MRRREKNNKKKTFLRGVWFEELWGMANVYSPWVIRGHGLTLHRFDTIIKWLYRIACMFAQCAHFPSGEPAQMAWQLPVGPTVGHSVHNCKRHWTIFLHQSRDARLNLWHSRRCNEANRCGWDIICVMRSDLWADRRNGAMTISWLPSSRVCFSI